MTHVVYLSQELTLVVYPDSTLCTMVGTCDVHNSEHYFRGLGRVLYM